jgi:predicted AAA+ superfamily ATPase
MFPRYAADRARMILTDTPVLGLIGPRQSGKATLARQIEPTRRYITLDDTNVLAAALADPVGMIRSLDKAIIDEIQRAPALMLAIKQSVDTDRSPGRFLVTGSANIVTLGGIHDSMVGASKICGCFLLARMNLRTGAQRIFWTGCLLAGHFHQPRHKAISSNAF